MGVSSKTSATCQIVDVTARYHADLELERMALHDHLTGLANRVLLDIRLRDELVHAEGSGRGLAVMFIDLDDFKMVNDTSGHRSGDEILIEIARRLAARIRPEDTIARMGGDEFVLICPGVTGGDDAMALAERLWTTVDDAIELGSLSYKVHLSIGVAVSSPGSTAGQMLSRADIALYAAKHAGKRRVTLYSADLGAAAAKQVQLEAELSVARSEQQFEVYHQPVVNMSSETIDAVEALIRWHHPTRGLLLPGAFLAAAERCGMMSDIGPWVLDQSCRQAAAWVDLFGADAPTVHVNVSTRQLDAVSFADSVLATVRRHNLSPRKLVLELTETYLAEVDATLFAQFETLAAHGIGLAADDYGTGYSPLTRITELPVSMIKIDQQFVREIGTDPRSHAVVDSVVSLARTPQLEVVAEGVETRTQARVLQDIGIVLAQGHLWHEAMPAQTITALLRVNPTTPAECADQATLPPSSTLPSMT
ncbi:MAG: putative bifunctional diguanylate cyclase/phosphodiesterase [Ilumatobacteraceae bacterium]